MTKTAGRRLEHGKQREVTPEFQSQYADRAGVEGLLSQGVRACGLRTAHYAGLAKTRLQHLLTAAALNLARLDAWFAERPRAATKPSRLVTLLGQPHVTAALT